MGKLTRIEKKRKKKKFFFNFLILLIIGSFILLFSLKSSYFNIDKFQIEGNQKLTDDQIIKSSMINKGENIFRIDKKGGKSSIEKIPYIKSVDINRKLPNKVEIKIVERKAVLLIQKLSTFLAIDKEGLILEQIDENEEKLPVFIGLNVDNVDLRDNVFSTKLNNDIIELIQESLNLNLIDNFDKIDLKTKDNINIILKDEIFVAFGSLDNVKYKLRLLDEILKDTKDKNIEYKKIIMNKGENPILVTDD